MKSLQLLIVILFLSLGFSPVVHATKSKTQSTKHEQVMPDELDPESFIPAKNQVVIDKYLPVENAYHLKRPDVPEATTLYATPESVAKAIKTMKISDLKKNPNSIVGNVYSLDN